MVYALLEESHLLRYQPLAEQFFSWARPKDVKSLVPSLNIPKSHISVEYLWLPPLIFYPVILFFYRGDLSIKNPHLFLVLMG